MQSPGMHVHIRSSNVTEPGKAGKQVLPVHNFNEL